jgi:hypothetical protein
MTRNLVVLALTTLLAAGAALAQFPESVLPNGDFEEGLTGWTPSVNDAKKLGVAVTVDETQAKHGAKSLKITLPGGPSGASVGSPASPVQGGQQYLVTLYFRSEGFSDTNLYAGVNLQYVLTWLDADKKAVGGGGAGLAYGAVKDWSFRCTLYRAPANAAFLAISFNMSCDEQGRASSAWFDRVQVRPWPEQALPAVKTWTYPVFEGAFDRDLFRRVADDDTATGFAVIANPRFMTKPGYLAGVLYLRALEPGQYRAVYRLKIGEIPAEPKGLLQWDLSTGGMGYLNSGAISTADFPKAGVYQDFAEPFVLPPDAQFVDPRVVWNGGITAWVDTITIVQEKVFTAEDLKALME